LQACGRPQFAALAQVWNWVSFDITEDHAIRRVGGSLLRVYERLVEQADHAAHDSPAQQQLAAFRLAWLTEPARLETECSDAERAEKERAEKEEKANG
jgi:hypothetical protein